MKRLGFFVLLMLLGLPALSEACREFHSVAVDDHGNVQAGAAVTVTNSTTHVVATLYGAPGCTTIITNPVSTTAVGDYQFFVADGVYDITVSKVGYNTHVIRNIGIISQFGENVRNVSEFGTLDLCIATTGVIDQIGATPTTLVISKGTFCTVDKTVPATLTLLLNYPGTITISTGKVLTIADPNHVRAPPGATIFVGPGTVSFTNSGTVYPRWWGTTGTNDDVAVNAAIAAVPGNSQILLEGSYTFNANVLVNKDRIHLKGLGPSATMINCQLPVDGTCLQVSNGASQIYQGSVSDLTFHSTDSTHTKVALDLVDASGYRLENLVVSGTVNVGSTYFWSGGTGSIGIQIRGREFIQVRNLYALADKPLVIADNPNSTIDIDHTHLTDLLLFANGYPCVTINDGVNLSNVQFDGANAWVLGTYGLYWSDTTTSISSNNLGVRGVRTEQGEDATAYSIYIAHNTVLQNLHIEDSFIDPTRKGIYLRKVQATLVQTTLYSGVLEAFNFVGSSVIQTISFQNCFFQQASTATLTNFILYDSMPEQQATKPIPDTAYYIYAGGTYLTTQRRRIPVFATADLPAAATAENGSIVIEDNGAGDRNIVIYGGGERFRINGGAAF